MANEGGKHFKPKGQPAPGPGGVQAPRPVSSQPVPPSPYARPARGAQAAGGQRPVVHGAQAGAPASSAYRAPQGDKSGRSGKGRGNVLSSILIAVGVALLLAAGGLFVKAQIGYKKANDYYNGIAEMAVKDSSGEDDIPQIDFDALKKVSDDIVGWIYVPRTRINYVVAQGETNNTYLRHLPNGEYSENGTIFMDMDGTAPGMVDQQTTLYGHHMTVPCSSPSMRVWTRRSSTRSRRSTTSLLR